MFSANTRIIAIWNCMNGLTALNPMEALAAIRPSCSLAIRRASKLWFASVILCSTLWLLLPAERSQRRRGDGRLGKKQYKKFLGFAGDTFKNSVFWIWYLSARAWAGPAHPPG